MFDHRTLEGNKKTEEKKSRLCKHRKKGKIFKIYCYRVSVTHKIKQLVLFLKQEQNLF